MNRKYRDKKPEFSGTEMNEFSGPSCLQVCKLIARYRLNLSRVVFVYKDGMKKNDTETCTLVCEHLLDGCFIFVSLCFKIRLVRAYAIYFRIRNSNTFRCIFSLHRPNFKSKYLATDSSHFALYHCFCKKYSAFVIETFRVFLSHKCIHLQSNVPD